MSRKIYHSQREKGENYEKWAKREREEHIKGWRYEKEKSGEWLSKEEYEKKTGRPGRK